MRKFSKHNKVDTAKTQGGDTLSIFQRDFWKSFPVEATISAIKFKLNSTPIDSIIVFLIELYFPRIYSVKQTTKIRFSPILR